MYISKWVFATVASLALLIGANAIAAFTTQDTIAVILGVMAGMTWMLTGRLYENEKKKKTSSEGETS